MSTVTCSWNVILKPRSSTANSATTRDWSSAKQLSSPILVASYFQTIFSGTIHEKGLAAVVEKTRPTKQKPRMGRNIREPAAYSSRAFGSDQERKSPCVRSFHSFFQWKLWSHGLCLIWLLLNMTQNERVLLTSCPQCGLWNTFTMIGCLGGRKSWNSKHLGLKLVRNMEQFLEKTVQNVGS